MADLDSYRELLDYLHEGAYVVDREGSITSWNKAAETISGYPAPEVVGKRNSKEILIHVNDQGDYLGSTLCSSKHSIDNGALSIAGIYLIHKEGYLLPVAVRVAPITNNRGEIVGGVKLFSYQSSEIAVLQKMTGLAEPGWLDRLTGIAGKNLTEINIHAYLEELKKYNWPFGLLFLDLDHFGQINYDYDHNVADHLLQIIAKTLAKNARSCDFLGRWGGEKFILAIFNANNTNLFDIAERYRKLIAHSRLILNNQAISVTVSVGATLACPDDSFASIVARVSQAMEKSKSSGRNCVTIEC